MSAYDPNNIFAKILRGEIPCHKVYEDADTMAFMDIMPRCQGHTLVVTKTPARNLLDASPAQIDRFRAEFMTPRKLAALYGTPREFPEYRPGYYAVFFEDPDRLKLEIVHFPAAPPA